MFRKSSRLFAAWWLLAMMALTVVPRELLHQCGPADDTHHEDAEGAALKTVCPVCDVAMPVAVAEDLVLVSVARQVSTCVHTPTSAAPALGHERRSADRGPPSA